MRSVEEVVVEEVARRARRGRARTASCFDRSSAMRPDLARDSSLLRFPFPLSLPPYLLSFSFLFFLDCLLPPKLSLLFSAVCARAIRHLPSLFFCFIHLQSSPSPLLI